MSSSQVVTAPSVMPFSADMNFESLAKMTIVKALSDAMALSGMNLKTIGLMILLSSANEFKPLIIDLLNEFKRIIKEQYTVLYYKFFEVIERVQNYFKRPEPQYQIETFDLCAHDPVVHQKTITYDFGTNLAMLDVFINVCLSGDGIWSGQKSLESIEVINIYESKEKCVVGNISMTNTDTEIKLSSLLYLEYLSSNGKRQLLSCSQDGTKTNLEPTEIADLIPGIVGDYLRSIVITEEMSKILFPKITLNNRVNVVNWFLEYINQSYPSIQSNAKNYHQFYTLVCIFGVNMNIKVINDKIYIDDIIIDCNKGNFKCARFTSDINHYTENINMINKVYGSINGRTLECKEKFEEFKKSYKVSNKTSTKSLSLEFNISTSSSQNIDDLFYDVMKSALSKVELNTSEKVNVYSVGIIQEESTTQQDNPNYESELEIYMERKKNAEGLGKEGNGAELLKAIGDAPSKKISVSTKSYKVNCEKVSEQEKPLNTLYLPEEDTRDLHSFLHKMKYSNDIYKKFGLRKKFGILLHGPPGTGKTSTITAIATFMGRDIYFVNLNSVKTNKHLKMIFDEINKSKTKKGLIVFEDIDVQSKISHRRFKGKDEASTDSTDVSSEEENIYRLMELGSSDDILNQSFLLNIVDGTITNDDLMFAITTNHLEVLDPALYRPGRIDVILEMKKCDHYQISNIYRDIVGKEICQDVLRNIKQHKYLPIELINALIPHFQSDAKCEVILKRFL